MSFKSSRFRHPVRLGSCTLAVVGAVAILYGCDTAPKTDQQPDVRADTVAVDRHRCIVPENTTLGGVQVATRCAELFVVRNGYTDRPPVPDSAQWVSESIEWGASAREMVQSRRNTLEPEAVGLCRDRRRTPGYAVFFRRTHPETVSLRGVTMDLDFTDLRMEHQDFGGFIAEPPPESGCVLFRPLPH